KVARRSLLALILPPKRFPSRRLRVSLDPGNTSVPRTMVRQPRAPDTHDESGTPNRAGRRSRTVRRPPELAPPSIVSTRTNGVVAVRPNGGVSRLRAYGGSSVAVATAIRRNGDGIGALPGPGCCLEDLGPFAAMLTTSTDRG